MQRPKSQLGIDIGISGMFFSFLYRSAVRGQMHYQDFKKNKPTLTPENEICIFYYKEVQIVNGKK